jgi:sigma-B regulation protein RsbU (phosphoserine phosphatase)
MATVEAGFLRTQLQQRRQRLEVALAGSHENAAVAQLLQEVDLALERMEKGTYGICEACHESIEKERLIADPLVRYCLTDLTTEQRRALEEDLELASQIQRALLPQQNLRVAGWQVHYHYDPVGPVSGDYCDLIPCERAGDLYFLLGDVAGKGVAASMLMSHLHAMFRSLTSVGLSLEQLVALANRVFCESTMAGQYATLVCGRAGRSGEVELCNAGHLPALLVRPGQVTRLDATGLPLGMFCDGQYSAKKLKLEKGESLFLYTDGLSETRDLSGAEYGLERVARFVGQQNGLGPEALTASCVNDVKAYSAGAPRGDDLTLMVLQRAD